MARGRSKYESCTQTRPRRASHRQANRRRQSAAARHRRRYISIDDCAVHLSFSAATPANLGPEELLPAAPLNISDAVILMAGAGSRLRGSAETIAKPLIPIGGRPLISYAIDSFHKAGVKTLYAVVGPNGDELAAASVPLFPSQMQFYPILNPNWQKQH